MPTQPIESNVVRVARRCFVRTSDSDDLAARCAAALATAAPNSVITGMTAARLHGLWLPPDSDKRVHIATAEQGRAARHMTRGRRAPFVGHRRQLAAADQEIVAGVRVTSLARTWIDLAVDLRVADLVAAGDSALRAGCTAAEIAEALGRSVHFRGVRRARAAAGLLDARSRSRPESHLRVAASSPRLPALAVNEAVYRDEGGWLAEPDLSLREAKLALEYQGEHHAEATRMRHDITRATDLRRNGWLCIYYGPAQVFGRPWEIMTELEAVLSARAPHLLRPR